MNISAFAVWKFQTIEGKLKNCRGFDFETTRFDKKDHSDVEVFQLKYDITYDKVTLEKYNLINRLSTALETVPFNEVEELLKKYGLYEVAPSNVRHACSYSKEEIASKMKFDN